MSFDRVTRAFDARSVDIASTSTANEPATSRARTKLASWTRVISDVDRDARSRGRRSAYRTSAPVDETVLDDGGKLFGIEGFSDESVRRGRGPAIGLRSPRADDDHRRRREVGIEPE